jgi:Uma2 family endonuclease
MAAPRLDDARVGYEQWLAWPETNRPVEVVDGQAIVSPAPDGRHQRTVARLVQTLAAAAPAGLEVLPGPIDWVLRDEPLHVRQPDVVVVDAEPQLPPRLIEPPLLVVEVVSPTSRERDLVHKRAEYAAAGLAWYWLVDLEVPQVLVLRGAGGAFETAVSATGEELCEVAEPFPVELRPADLA